LFCVCYVVPPLAAVSLLAILTGQERLFFTNNPTLHIELQTVLLCLEYLHVSVKVTTTFSLYSGVVTPRTVSCLQYENFMSILLLALHGSSSVYSVSCQGFAALNVDFFHYLFSSTHMIIYG
jgi:hypothetical protein